MTRRHKPLAALSVTLAAVLLLSGCTALGFDTPGLDEERDTLEDQAEAAVEAVDGVSGAQAFPGTGRLSVDAYFDDCETAVATAPDVAAAAFALDPSRVLSVTLQVEGSGFRWIAYTPDREDRFVAATRIWCDTFEHMHPITANVSPPRSFLRGEEFGLWLIAPDEAAAEVLRLEATQLAVDAGFRVRPDGGVTVQLYSDVGSAAPTATPTPNP
ncbi:MAG: hypothetical protein ABI566_08750 [Pseudolysinimonas sp.]